MHAKKCDFGRAGKHLGILVSNFCITYSLFTAHKTAVAWAGRRGCASIIVSRTWAWTCVRWTRPKRFPFVDHALRYVRSRNEVSMILDGPERNTSFCICTTTIRWNTPLDEANLIGQIRVALKPRAIWHSGIFYTVSKILQKCMNSVTPDGPRYEIMISTPCKK